ncbi:uncharacterized protein LOC142605832 [Castanea sativa]|uniref:uncharacterized protein LOC142605832 n=1 Tax=Castanea sativa TaxID=21020 RepID=UPI003F6543D2
MREGCSFGEFHKQNPPTFNGESHPMAVENWLLKMEKLLRALKCTNMQKVVYATFALQGSAKRWWMGTECLLWMELGENTSITWEKFKEVFNETYFPAIVRDQKAREFFDLIQGTMNVEEYATTFVELSHFTPYLILDKTKKVTSRVGNITETVKRAMSFKEDFKCNPSSKKGEKKQEPSGFLHVKGRW